MVLQLRDNKTRTYPDCWSIFGGRLEPGETPKDGVVREIREELGIGLDRVTYLGELIEDPCDRNDRQGSLSYVFHSDISGAGTALHLNEGASYGLFEWEHIRTKMRADVAPLTLSILESFFKGALPQGAS